jgi:hypothetical protein
VHDQTVAHAEQFFSLQVQTAHSTGLPHVFDSVRGGHQAGAVCYILFILMMDRRRAVVALY